MSHAGMLGTKCVSKLAKANENWPWTQIPSEKRWQTWPKGKIWHTLVPSGEQAAFWRNTQTHTEKLLWRFKTPPIEHMTLLLITAGIYSSESFLTTNLRSKCFFFFFFLSGRLFYLPVISWSLKELRLLCVSPPYICSEGATAFRGKKDPALDFQLNCQRLTVLINPAQ